MASPAFMKVLDIPLALHAALHAAWHARHGAAAHAHAAGRASATHSLWLPEAAAWVQRMAHIGQTLAAVLGSLRCRFGVRLTLYASTNYIPSTA